jgi:hypothetical protein
VFKKLGVLIMIRKDVKIAASLGTFAAIGVLLAGTSVAQAQRIDNNPYGGSPDLSVDAAGAPAAPGGGSFPGSFLIPGTNTSLKVGGLAKLAIIYDMSAPPDNASTLGSSTPDTTAVEFIPLGGTAAHSLHNAVEFNPRQSNFNFDVRTPTAYGELETFLMVDFYGRENPTNTISAFNNTANPEAARMVLAYGTLGPVLAGQMTSLWFDGDAMPETVDPSPTVATMNILSNRQVQLRYTYAGANGFSMAVDAEEPQAEGYSNTTFNPSPLGFTSGIGAATNSFSSQSLGGVNHVPDFLARARLDQAWGHIAVTALYRDLSVVAPAQTLTLGGAATSVVPRVQKDGYGGQVSGHLNTFGKDTAKLIIMGGQGIGHYDSDFINVGGVDVGSIAGATTTATGVARSLGANISYTHWWTDTIRSTADAGWARLYSDTSVITSLAALNGLDKYHIQATGNLIWSPVPQVDVGIEFDWAKRVTNAATAIIQDFGYENRIESMMAFKF